MANLEERVGKLEDKVRELEININNSLGEIKNSLIEIKSYVKNTDDTSDLKNEVVKKDIENNSIRIQKLEDNQNKIIWTIVMGIIGVLGKIIYSFSQNGG